MTKEIEPVDYQIDIITESFLEKYIAIVDSEISKIKRIFQRNKAIIEKSIEKITEKAKEIDKIRENDKEIINYRDFFENL
jgi:vacuolar-type H+-ATPase subunit I/STV1